MKKASLIACLIFILFEFASAQTQSNQIGSTGVVGIGTATPNTTANALMHVFGVDKPAKVILEGTYAGGGYGRIDFIGKPSLPGHSIGYLQANSTRGSSTPVAVSAIDFYKDGSGADDKTGIIFYTHDGSSFNQRMWLTSQGRLGIGTSTPASGLHLYGTIGASSLTVEGAVNNGAYGKIQLNGRPSNADESVGYIEVNSTRGGQTAVRVASIDFPKQGNGSDDLTGITFSTHDGTSLAERLKIAANGNVGIGTSSAPERLSVNGNILANKIIVRTSWSDYVFDKKYKLQDLYSVENFIKENKRLPGIPSAKEVEEKGISVGDTQALLLKKIEELTLYVIRQQKEIDTLKKLRSK